MITCKEVADVISSGDLERLGAWRRWQVQFHLWMCKKCARFSRQLEQIRRGGQRLRSGYESERPTDARDAFENRLLRKLEELPVEDERKR